MPDTPAAETSRSLFQSIPLDQIKPSPHQARKDFDEESIKGLAESMRQEGLLQPITVRPVSDGFELISGERRLRAAKLLAWQAIEAKVIQTVSEGEASAKGLVENLQRQDLNPIEEAEGFKELNDLDPQHWTQENIGKVIGRSQNRISASISLLTLSKPVQDSIRQRILSREHGIELLRLNNANSQKAIANKVIKGGWSVKKTREAISKKVNAVRTNDVGMNDVRTNDVTLIDPLSSLWEKLKADQPNGYSADWQVKYGPAETWTFTAKPHGGDYPSFLSDWFSEMAESISPLLAPKFTECRYDPASREIYLAWDIVPQALGYEVWHSFRYPEEPLKIVNARGLIPLSEYSINLKNPDKHEVWLAVKAVAAAGRASPMSEPSHLSL